MEKQSYADKFDIRAKIKKGIREGCFSFADFEETDK